MNLLYAVILGIFLLPSTAYAQSSPAVQKSSTYHIRGILCDSLTHEPEPFATIRLLYTGNEAKLYKAVTTDTQGHFVLPLERKGDYLLEAIVMGKAPLYRTVTVSETHSEIMLDTLCIHEYGQALGVAEVTGSKTLVKADIDKLTYNAAEDPEAQTSTMLDMLRKVPMVAVDGEENIQVNGNSNFKVYVDGKPNQMMSANPSLILKNYPAAVVKNVEVITSPGAKYDAEGVGAVLNIVTKTKTQTTGYVLTPSLQQMNNFTKGSAFGMFQMGKLMLSVNGGAGGHNHDKRGYSSSQREVFADAVNHFYSQQAVKESKMLYHFEEIMASYEFSSKDLLSISADLYTHKMKSHQQGNTQMSSQDWQPVYSYDLMNRSKRNYLSVNIESDFQHTFRQGTYLTFSYSMQHNKNAQENTDHYVNLYQLPESFVLYDLHAVPENLSSEHTVQVDFTSDFLKHHTLSAGLKYIHRFNRSNNEEYSRPSAQNQEFIFDTENSLHYRHRGDIGAAYLEYTLRLGNWTMMAGQRYECYHIDVSYTDNRRPAYGATFHNWVPSVTLGYRFSSATMLKGGYNLRIGRPDIGSLSPYVNHRSPLEISYGNPNLSTTTSHNLNMSFSYFKPKLSVNVALSQSLSNDGLSQYSFIKEGVQHTTYGNILHSKNTVLNTYLNWNIVPGSSLNFNISGMYGDFSSNTSAQHNSGFSGNGFLGYNQRLPWNLHIGLWAGGGTQSHHFQGTSPGYYYVSTHLKKTFFEDKRLELMLTASNFFKRYAHYHHTTVTDQFRFDSESQVEQMRIGLGITYRLGSLKSRVKTTHRSIKNDDQIAKSKDDGSSQE